MDTTRWTLRGQYLVLMVVSGIVFVVLAAAALVTRSLGVVVALVAWNVVTAGAIFVWLGYAALTPLGEIVAALESVAGGDLSPKAETARRGPREIGRLRGALEKTVANLREILAGLKQSAANVSNGAAEILAAVVQQSAGANEQASSISETSTTVTEVRQTSEQAARRAQEIVAVSDQSAQVYEEGEEAVNKTVEEFNLIAEQVEKSAVSVLTLSEKTQQISEILRTVRELAERSNILSLNAAIEAARAGEAGKGFGVVAVEVRNLSDQSKAAAGQIQEILNEIQSAVNTSVMVAEEATKRVDRGKSLVNLLSERMKNLSETIEGVRQSAKQISSSANQQSIGMEQIALAMENINQVAAEYVAGTKDTEEAAHHLSDLGAKLSGLTDPYKL
jgi:methyl-accepting chemotaxis protein